MCVNTTQFKPSQPLDSDYRTLVTTYKLGNYRRKWFLTTHHQQHKQDHDDGMKAAVSINVK